VATNASELAAVPEQVWEVLIEPEKYGEGIISIRGGASIGSRLAGQSSAISLHGPSARPRTLCQKRRALQRLAKQVHAGPHVTVDAIVIGLGPNGLVAANTLADAGWDVPILEAQPDPGGTVRTARSRSLDSITICSVPSTLSEQHSGGEVHGTCGANATRAALVAQRLRHPLASIVRLREA
jgi:NAD(P)-binding Rossmann-like domain